MRALASRRASGGNVQWPLYFLHAQAAWGPAPVAVHESTRSNRVAPDGFHWYRVQALTQILNHLFVVGSESPDIEILYCPNNAQ